LNVEDLVVKISNILRQKNLKIATAESCTGGLIANIITNMSGSSDFFERGVVTYSNESKMELLDVPQDLLIKYGAVSKQVAKAMAKGIRKNSKVDIGISTTGIAGPAGATKTKPVGLVFIGISTKDFTKAEKFTFSKNRIGNKEEACKSALNQLYNYLESI